MDVRPRQRRAFWPDRFFLAWPRLPRRVERLWAHEAVAPPWASSAALPRTRNLCPGRHAAGRRLVQAGPVATGCFLKVSATSLKSFAVGSPRTDNRTGTPPASTSNERLVPRLLRPSTGLGPVFFPSQFSGPWWYRCRSMLRSNSSQCLGKASYEPPRPGSCQKRKKKPSRPTPWNAVVRASGEDWRMSAPVAESAFHWPVPFLRWAKKPLFDTSRASAMAATRVLARHQTCGVRRHLR